MLILRDAWAVHDLQLCNACPHEIAEDTPGVVIGDNDDFRNDTLTGGSTSHRTDVMHVQFASLEYRGPQCDERVKDVNVYRVAGTWALRNSQAGRTTDRQEDAALWLWVLKLKGSVLLFTHLCVQMMLANDHRLLIRKFLVLRAFKP